MELTITLLIIILIAIIILGIAGITIVNQQTAFTIEFFGKFNRVIYPGINFVIPFIETKAKKVNLATLDMNFSIMAITSDKVTISIHTTLIYKVQPDKIYQSVYALNNPKSTIEAIVENSIRAFVATQTHEEVIQARDEMTNYLVRHLREEMEEYGYTIESFQMRDIILPAEITEAMSRVISSKRIEEATRNEAEANYTLQVREAQARRETQMLEGQGIAMQRDAIIKGLSNSVQEMQHATGMGSRDVMNVVVLNQYIDMMRSITNDKNGNVKTVFMNPNPGGINDIVQQISSLTSGSAPGESNTVFGMK
jgi:regulator of protease activity HflC (stomatin/prohibitin superfamily)